MMMDDYKNPDNFQSVKGYKMTSLHHFHPTKGVGSEDSSTLVVIATDGVAIPFLIGL